jgi:hypothetical protein
MKKNRFTLGPRNSGDWLGEGRNRLEMVTLFLEPEGRRVKAQGKSGRCGAPAAAEQAGDEAHDFLLDQTLCVRDR